MIMIMIMIIPGAVENGNCKNKSDIQEMGCLMVVQKVGGGEGDDGV